MTLDNRRARNERHGNWKGDQAGILAIHHWVKRRKKKTGRCSHCGEERYTEWANVSGEYRRDLDDFIELCKPCHCKFDEWPRKGGTSWNAGRKAPQLGRKCPPGCTCGRHRYWSRRPKMRD